MGGNWWEIGEMGQKWVGDELEMGGNSVLYRGR